MAAVYLAQDLRHDRPVALKVLHPALAASARSRPVPPGDPARRPAAASAHPHGARFGRGPSAGRGAAPLVHDALHPRGEPARPARPRDPAPGGGRAPDRARSGRRAGLRARRGHHPPGREAGEHPADRQPRAGGRLRHRAGARRGGRAEAHRDRHGGGDARLHEPRAGGGREASWTRAPTSTRSGVVLYEMLAGETPFAAPTAQATIARRFMETARPLREAREAVPVSVEQAVQRALARTAADRFATAAQFAAALAPAGPGSVPVATAVTAAAAPAVAPQETASAHVAARRRFPLAAASLALGFVLGLGLLFGWLRRHGEASGAGRRQAARGAAIREPGRRGRRVLLGRRDRRGARQARRVARPPGHRPQQLEPVQEGDKEVRRRSARELGVDYLLTGTVRWEKAAGSSHVRVSPELIQVSTGSTKWQQPFDATLTDVFKVQADVAGQVAQALDVALGMAQRAVLAERPTTNSAAYDAYLKGEAAAVGRNRRMPRRCGRRSGTSSRPWRWIRPLPRRGRSCPGLTRCST